MVNLYSGTPGSGKSLHMAMDIFYHLKYGRTVICNFPINTDCICKGKYRGKFVYIDNSKLTPEYLIEFSREYFNGKKRKEGQISLYIDECQLLFNAREWNKQGRDGWLSFYTQHRHFGYNIYLVAQFDRMIDRQIRSLIEYNYIHRKVSNFGIQGFILSLLSGGNLFCCVKVWYPLNERVGFEFYHCKKKFYRLYDTFTTFGE